MVWFLKLKKKDYLCSWSTCQCLKQKFEDIVTYKLVANDPLNEPSWIFFIDGIVECSLNLCLQYADIDVLVRFKGLDGIG